MITVHTAKPGVVIGREGSTKTQVVEELQVDRKDCVFDGCGNQKSWFGRNFGRKKHRRTARKPRIFPARKDGYSEGDESWRQRASKRLFRAGSAEAEIARSELQRRNSSFATLRADIDYAVAEALTTYGKLGVKVWIYKGRGSARQKAKKEEQ